jgi:DNA-binding transcriptional LysR family regulator
MAIYVSPTHPLVEQRGVEWELLQTWRELRLNTYLEKQNTPARGPVWSAPNYLMLLSMAAQGLGWCALPCALVEEFSRSAELTMLDIAGWPMSVSIDLLWHKEAPLGAAGSWLRQYLQQVPA